MRRNLSRVTRSMSDVGLVKNHAYKCCISELLKSYSTPAEQAQNSLSDKFIEGLFLDSFHPVYTVTGECTSDMVNTIFHTARSKGKYWVTISNVLFYMIHCPDAQLT